MIFNVYKLFWYYKHEWFYDWLDAISDTIQILKMIID